MISTEARNIILLIFLNLTVNDTPARNGHHKRHATTHRAIFAHASSGKDFQYINAMNGLHH